MTIAQLKEFARTTKLTYGNIKKIYDHMEANKVAGSTIELKLMEETVEWMVSNGYKTFEEYEVAYNKSVEIMHKATSLDRKETSLEDMRKKLGYNNAQWKIILGLEKTMATELKKLIVEFMSSAIVDGKSLKAEDVSEDKLFKALDLRWRNFSRNYLIPKYPGSKTNSDLRTRITGLFSLKLLEALKIKAPVETENTAGSDI